MARYPAAWILPFAVCFGLVTGAPVCRAGGIFPVAYDKPAQASDAGDDADPADQPAEPEQASEPAQPDQDPADSDKANPPDEKSDEPAPEPTPAQGGSDDATPSDDNPSPEPSKSSSDPPSPQASQDGSEPELIQERYPNRSIKVEREVTQDANGNYINHGSWKMWDQRGNVIAEGQYLDGERHGTWNRWFRTGEAELLNRLPYQQFSGPYISQANFENGKLDGKWTIYDSKQHKISEWDFSNGLRHGKSTWWFASGKKLREIDYREGDIDGELIEWNADGKVVLHDTYQGGRKLAPKVAYHSDSQKKSEGLYLYAKDVMTTPDDWWNAKLAVYTKQGKDEKHGAWTAWYASGQKQMQGTYKNDAQVGKFLWWHLNGQKAIEGTYENGKQQGRWVWWHDNGQKSIQGDYLAGNPTGHWTWWKTDGKVNQSADLSHAVGKIVELPESPAEAPRAQQPTRSRGKFYR